MKNVLTKRIVYGLFAIGITVGFSNCTVKHVHHTKVVKAKRIPPGQAKKIHGDQSARRHAPGHNK